MPRATSSWSLVSSRQTAAGRSGASAASAASEAGGGAGDSKATTVSAERSTRSSSPARLGRKPSKRQRSVGSPEATSAVGHRRGPWQDLDLQVAVDAGADQPVARVGDRGRPRVADQHDPGPALDLLRELRARSASFPSWLETSRGRGMSSRS